jgi:hypothetical protein
MKTFGWPPPQNQWPQTAAGAVAAASSASAAYERPLVAGSDVHASIIEGIFDSLAPPASGNTAVVPTGAGGGVFTGTSFGKHKPHSAGGVVSEPVYGFGANSGIPYSFGENGPEMVSPSMNTGSNPGAPGATQYGQQTTNELLQQLCKLMQQQPYALAQAQKNGLNAGMRRGAFNTGS